MHQRLPLAPCLVFVMQIYSLIESLYDRYVGGEKPTAGDSEDNHANMLATELGSRNRSSVFCEGRYNRWVEDQTLAMLRNQQYEQKNTAPYPIAFTDLSYCSG